MEDENNNNVDYNSFITDEDDDDDDDETYYEVVCVSSGTKCINGEKLSLEGCVINDSHSEIVARRCLILYLYKQLEFAFGATDINDNKSILTKTEDGKYK